MMGCSTLTGRTIGHYLVLEPLGQGGTGAVYKARDTRLGRLAALKVMRPDWAGDPAARRRALREAQTASALDHPHILTIYEIDTDAGLDFIAMELVAGGTLADLLTSGPLPVERALRLAAQVADALSAAHGASIVHRDLKPANVMMPAPDRVKVADFGLGGTANGAVVGTAPYMSPEQASGRAVDARSDLFSLGTMLYEMLAGRSPFRAESDVSTLAAILEHDPAPIEGIGPDVARAVERCLRRDAAERFQSAAELKAAIEACLSPRHGQGPPSIAVLPFASMTGAKEDEYLCEGLAEQIIDSLTRIPGLRVIARTSAFAVGRMGLEAREAGARLGVTTLLEGSARRAGSRVRVTAQLISTDDGSHLWSERYDRELTDALALEEEIAAAIAALLRVELARGERGPARPPASAVAYAAYLEGRYFFSRAMPQSTSQAMACFQRAAARDPGFALSYGSLAELHWYRGFFGNAEPKEAFSLSTWNALRALELDDTLAPTHALLGMLRKELDYNWPEAERELRRALELNRESPLVRLRYAIGGLLPHGRVEEGLAEVEVLLQTDPLSLLVHWWAAVMAYLARRPERVVEEGRHMIALDAMHFLGHWALGAGLTEDGDMPGAIASLEKAHELSGGMPFTLGFLAYACGRAGRHADAARFLDRAAKLAALAYVPPSAFALGHIGLGDWDAAIRWLDRAIDARDPIVMAIKTLPFLDPVRGDPRYLDLLRKMRLE